MRISIHQKKLLELHKVPPCAPSECHKNKAETGKGGNVKQLAIKHGVLAP